MKASKRFSTLAMLLALLLVFSQSQCASAADLDPEDFRGRLTMSGGEKVPYYRTLALNRRNTRIDRAVIAIHGASRRADRTWERVLDAAIMADTDDATLIIAPLFQTEEDKPLDDEPFWKGGWRQGDRSKDGSDLSSFSVVDHIYAQLCDAGKFPNLKTIILAGHSAGGQFVNRYAAAGQAWARQGIQLRFAVMNPSSYLYLSDERVSIDGDYFLYTPKGVYNDYKYGLDNLNSYAGAVGVNGLRDNLTSREVYYLGGTADVQWDENLDGKWPAQLQGWNRYDRFLRYQFHVETYIDPLWDWNSFFIPVEGVAHSEKGMYQSWEGMVILFL